MGKWWTSFRKTVAPTDKDLALEQGKKFIASITAQYSIEEQSEVVLALRPMLLTKRYKEIEDTKQHLARLELDVEKLTE